MLKFLRLLTLPALVLGFVYVAMYGTALFYALKVLPEGESVFTALGAREVLVRFALGVLVLGATFVARAIIIARMKQDA